MDDQPVGQGLPEIHLQLSLQGSGRPRELRRAPHMAHVLRGGAYYNHARDMRCAVQYWNGSFYRVDDLGFRVVASPVS